MLPAPGLERRTDCWCPPSSLGNSNFSASLDANDDDGDADDAQGDDAEANAKSDS